MMIFRIHFLIFVIVRVNVVRGDLLVKELMQVKDVLGMTRFLSLERYIKIKKLLKFSFKPRDPSFGYAVFFDFNKHFFEPLSSFLPLKFFSLEFMIKVATPSMTILRFGEEFFIFFVFIFLIIVLFFFILVFFFLFIFAIFCSLVRFFFSCFAFRFVRAFFTFIFLFFSIFSFRRFTRGLLTWYLTRSFTSRLAFGGDFGV